MNLPNGNNSNKKTRPENTQHSVFNVEPLFHTTDKKYLNTFAVRREFERLLKYVLRGAEFWRKESMFEVDLTSESDLYILQSDRVCISLKFVVNPPIKGVFIFHRISVDIVPSLHIKGYWPDEAIQEISENLKSDGCHLVFDEPYKLYPWISSSSIPYARISFARAESRVIRIAPPLAKKLPS